MAEKRISVRFTASGGKEVQAEAAGIRLAVDNTTQAINRSAKSASDSASIFEAAIEREAEGFRSLKAALDPAFAAQVRYEQQVETVNRAVFAGITTQAEANRVLAQAEAAMDNAVRSYRTAGPSVEAFNRALAEEQRTFTTLRASLDPTFAATRRFEEAQEAAQRAVARGAATQQQANAVIAQAKLRYEEAIRPAARMGTTIDTTGGAMRGLRGHAQNLSFQIQDLAVQIGSGTSASVALGQQLPQLLSGFGLVGAMMGTVAAIAIPLAGQLLGIGSAAEKAEERMKSLGATVDDYVQAAHGAARTPLELSEDYGINIAQARELLEVRRALQRLDAERNLLAAGAGASGLAPYAADQIARQLREQADILGQIADLKERAAEADNAREAEAIGAQIRVLQAALRGYDNLNSEVVELADSIGLVGAAAAERLAVALAKVDDSTDPRAQAEAWRDVGTTLLDAVGGYENLNEEGRKLLDQSVAAAEAALRMAAVDLASGIGSAADEAARLSQNMASSLSAYAQYQSSRAYGQTQGLNGGGNLVDRIIGVESGGNASARNPMSSASGLGQFIDSTWIAQYRKHFEDAAAMTDAAILALKTDAATSRAMVDLYIQDNAKILAQAGQATTDANLYLAHFLGPQGAIDVLRNLDANLSETVNAAARAANPSILGGDRTGRDLVAWAQGKVGVSEGELGVMEARQASAARAAAEAERERIRIAEEAAQAAARELGLRRNLIAATDQAAQSRQLELALIGKTTEEQVRLRTAASLTAQALANGIDLNERIAGSTLTYGERIEEAARAAGRGAAQAEAATQSEERLTQARQRAEAELQQFVSSLTGMALGPVTSSPIGRFLSSLSGFQSGAESAISGFLNGGLGGGFGAIGTALGGLSGGGLAGLGTAIGSIAAPVGAVIGLFSALRGKTETLDQGLRVVIDGLDATATAFERTRTTRFWGLMKSEDFDEDPAGGRVANTTRAAFGRVSDQVMELAAELGIGADAFEDFQYRFKLSIDLAKSSPEQIRQAIEKEMVKVGESMASLGGDLDPFRRQGEAAGDALQRLVSSLGSANEVLDAFGYTLFDASLTGAAAASRFAEAFGGLDAMAQATGAYLETFYSLPERLSSASEAFTGQAAKLWRAPLETIADFRTAVDALMARGQTGMAADLLALADDFKAILDLRDEVAAGASGNPNLERLQRELWEAQGRTDLIREAELEGLTAAEKAMQRRIWAIEDEQKALEELNRTRDALDPRDFRTALDFARATARIASRPVSNLPTAPLATGSAPSGSGGGNGNSARRLERIIDNLKDLKHLMTDVAYATDRHLKLTRRWANEGWRVTVDDAA